MKILFFLIFFSTEIKAEEEKTNDEQIIRPSKLNSHKILNASKIVYPPVLKNERNNYTSKMIYLNGMNISSVKNQELEQVDIKIDNYGNIYITAPQYDVSIENSYHPLLPSEIPQFDKEKFNLSPTFPKNKVSKFHEDAEKINKKESNTIDLNSKNTSIDIIDPNLNLNPTLTPNSINK